MSGEIRLDRLRFDRRAAIPIAASSGAAINDFDWERLASGDIATGGVAFPRTLETAAVTVTLMLRVVAPFDTTVHVRGRSLNGSPLGDFGPAPLPSGDEGATTVTLRLAGANIASSGVERHQMSWAWESSTDEVLWTAFETTRHDMFVLLDEPHVPWGRPAAPKTAALWLDVLDQAHQWARSTRTPEQTITSVTRGVHGLGGQTILNGRGEPDTITYGEVAMFGATVVFQLSEFIATARLEPGTATALNCADCAGAVALFSAALGCPLRVTRFEPSRGEEFDTNPVRLLGQRPVERTAFSFHEVACTVRDRRGDRAWDACLELDLDERPAERPPSDLGLAFGMPLQVGAAELSYVERLTAPRQALPSATLRATDGLRYPDRLPPGVRPPADVFLSQRRDQFAVRLSAADSSEPLDGVDVDRPLRDALLARSLMTRTLRFETDVEAYSLTSVRVPLLDDARSIQVVSFGTWATRAIAVDLFLWLAAAFTTPLRRVPDLADYAIASPAHRSVLMLRGRTVVLLATESTSGASSLPIALALDGALDMAYRP